MSRSRLEGWSLVGGGDLSRVASLAGPLKSSLKRVSFDLVGASLLAGGEFTEGGVRSGALGFSEGSGIGNVPSKANTLVPSSKGLATVGVDVAA